MLSTFLILKPPEHKNTYTASVLGIYFFSCWGPVICVQLSYCTWVTQISNGFLLSCKWSKWYRKKNSLSSRSESCCQSFPKLNELWLFPSFNAPWKLTPDYSRSWWDTVVLTRPMSIMGFSRCYGCFDPVRYTRLVSSGCWLPPHRVWKTHLFPYRSTFIIQYLSLSLSLLSFPFTFDMLFVHYQCHLQSQLKSITQPQHNVRHLSLCPIARLMSFCPISSVFCRS